MSRADPETAARAASRPRPRPLPPPPGPAVRLEGVGLRYGRGAEVLRDVTISLEPGSFHFLTGPSGAGKSSLLRIMYLAQPPSRGLVRLFEIDAATASRETKADLRRRVGVVFQDFRLLAHLDVFDNIALPLRVAGLAPASYADDVAELIAWVGLKERMHAAPETLSGGEQQRVAIARAVVAKPDLLLADEPTGNVDPEMGRRLLRLFVELNRLGTTVVVATHDPELVRAIGAPSLVLHEGGLERRAAG